MGSFLLGVQVSCVIDVYDYLYYLLDLVFSPFGI